MILVETCEVSGSSWTRVRSGSLFGQRPLQMRAGYYLTDKRLRINLR
jgi:hypothetical protein